MLIELVSDDSGESHKKKEGMPKGSTGISFTLMCLSFSLHLFPPTFFSLDRSSFFFFVLFCSDGSSPNTPISIDRPFAAQPLKGRVWDCIHSTIGFYSQKRSQPS